MKLFQALAEREARVKHDEADMRVYQTDELVPFLQEHPYSLAAVDMGLGKTVSVLTVLEKLISAGDIRKALIIAPIRVAVQTWPTEIAEWSHTWWMRHSLIRPDAKHPELIEAVRKAREEARDENVIDSAIVAAQRATSAHKLLQRKRLARSNAPIHIINREAVEWLVDYFGDRWPYDCVIVDESRDFADYKSDRWRALNRIRPYVKRMHLLSGIPAPEGVQDYFAQIFLLDRGERLTGFITHFRNRYMTQNIHTRKWIALPGADKEVSAKIADITIVMREDDYLPRDKPLVVERPIILDPDEMVLYRRFARTSIMKLPEVEIEAENGAILAQKLMQMASGAVYDEFKKTHVIHDHKLEEIKQIREEIGDEPIMIAYWHQSSLARLRKLLPKATVMDREGKCVGPWNKGKIRDLLIHPRSGGHGLNMQLGPGRTLVYFDNPLPLQDYLQLIKRIDRPGQKRLVKVFHLVTQGTADVRVVPVLRRKDDAQDTIRRYIRDLRREWRVKDDSATL